MPDYKGDLTIAVYVKDRAAAMAWYQEVLGFELLYEAPEIGWCELRSPVANVNVGLGEREDPQLGAGPVPVWGVGDIDAARAELESKGVRFDGDTMTIPDLVRLATFYDPDGNAFMLAQSLGGA
jgi:CreA protein